MRIFGAGLCYNYVFTFYDNVDVCAWLTLALLLMLAGKLEGYYCDKLEGYYYDKLEEIGYFLAYVYEAFYE